MVTRKKPARKKSSRKTTASTTRRKARRTTSASASSSTRKRSASGRRYGKAASDKVEETMHELKRGKLRSGRGGRKVKSRKQAIAIGLSQARKRGAKVPKNPNEK